VFFPILLPSKGTTGTHQTNLPGKCGQLGFSQICGKTGSVDSDLQFLGTTNTHQDKGINPKFIWEQMIYKYVGFLMLAYMLFCIIILITKKSICYIFNGNINDIFFLCFGGSGV
jgi:hypothetical protein